jgi:ABC-type transport system involved in cytochrome bd biosynthesis fused ATPase/permease subunit
LTKIGKGNRPNYRKRLKSFTNSFKKKKKSILIGEAGVGKSAIAEGLASFRKRLVEFFLIKLFF